MNSLEMATGQRMPQARNRVVGSLHAALRVAWDGGWRGVAAASLLALSGAGAAQAQVPQQAQRPVAVAAQGQEIVMAERTQLMLPVAGVPVRVLIDDPSVADVQILSANKRADVFVQGLQPGRTTVQVWSRGQQQPQRWPVRVVSDVHASLLTRQQPVQAQVDVSGGSAVVSGHSDTLMTHRNAAAVAGAGAAPERIVDTSTVGPNQVVQVEVKVVEVNTSVLKEVGINWRGGRAGNNWQGGNNVGSAGVIGDGFSLLYSASNFGASLNLLQSNGMARILAEPTLVALSGQSASFLAGGEIPVPAAGSLGTQNVEFKSYGIGLSVAPTVLSADRIALKIAPEASDLDYNNAIAVGDSLIPAIRTRRADTMVELADGESFVISGLVSRETTANVDKFPFLGDLPIIGTFFRNMKYEQKERELVIVVTPRLVRPIAKGVALPLPGETREQSDQAINGWSYFLLGPATGQGLPGFSR
ncbi:type II and III secretion system protein family protein [Kerstersia similis]|uniref:type II and III secretion system protein family protein n=1 Tax=Kerstersia similis TaxID=206505 RepID=UPI0039F14730